MEKKNRTTKQIRLSSELYIKVKELALKYHKTLSKTLDKLVESALKTTETNANKC